MPIINKIENLRTGKPLGDEGLVNGDTDVNLSVNLQDLVRGTKEWAAARDWTKDILKVAPVILGASLALALREPAAAASLVEPVNQGLQHLGIASEVKAEIVQWAPPLVTEVGAFVAGFASGLRDATSQRYKIKVEQHNLNLRAAISNHVQPGVEELVGKLIQTGQLKKEQQDEFMAEKLERETEKIFEKDERRAVLAKPLRFAVEEGLELGLKLGGASLLTSDVLLGMEPLRLVADLGFAAAGLTGLRRINPRERLWASTIVSAEI